MKLSVNIYISLIALMLSTFVLQSQTMTFGKGLAGTDRNMSKPQLSVSLETSFTSFSPGYTSFGTTIMPQVTFPVSDKFSLSTGIGYSTYFMGNGETMFNSNLSSYGHIFVSGTYDINERISLRGTGYKTFNLNTTKPINDNNSTHYDFSSQGFIMDVEYRVTDNFRINVGFEYRQQNSPIYNPNGHNPNSPFMNTVSLFPSFNNGNSIPF